MTTPSNRVFKESVSSFLTSHYPLQVPSYTEALQHLETQVAGERRSTKVYTGQRTKKLVTVNINGVLFTLARSTCIRIPVLQSVLEARTDNDVDPEDKRGRRRANKEALFFERNPTAFAAIVDYVQNNELHVPPCICPKLFAREIVAWGFDIDEVETCCFSGLVHFLWEQDKLSEFHGFLNKSKWGYDADDLHGSSSNVARKRNSSLKKRIFLILEEPFSSRAATVYFYIVCFFILLTFMKMVVDSVKAWQGMDDLQNAVKMLDVVAVSYLTLDYIMRFVCCPKRKLFLRQPINVTDAVALLASYAQFLYVSLLHLYPEYEKTLNRFEVFFELMEILRLLRILRILRPMSKVSGFRLIYFTLKASLNELLLVLMLLIFLILIFSNFMYYLGDHNIRSIPHAMWYCLITLTTVGYGDIAPLTIQGKIFGSIVAVFGIIVMSMTMPIMVSNFNTLYINAVVGRPSAIKKIYQDLDREITEQMHSCANAPSIESEWKTATSDKSVALPKATPSPGCCGRLKKILPCVDDGSLDRLSQPKRGRRFKTTVELDSETNVTSEEEEVQSPGDEQKTCAKPGNKWWPTKARAIDLQEAVRKLMSAGLIRRRDVNVKDEDSEEDQVDSFSGLSSMSASFPYILSVPTTLTTPVNSPNPSRLVSDAADQRLLQPLDQHPAFHPTPQLDLDPDDEWGMGSRGSGSPRPEGSEPRPELLTTGAEPPRLGERVNVDF